MPLDLSFRGRTVLLRGVDDRTAATADALLRDGARVWVDPMGPAELPASVADLLDRGLVEPAHGCHPGAFDVVLRATGAARGRTPEAAPTAGPSPDATSGPRARTTGRVTLLGGGVGDPGLLPVAGLEALASADVVVHDRLAPLAALRHLRPDAVVIDVGKIPRGRSTPQERINELLVEHALAGRHVVRLKGGDSFVFGRGGEEAEACAAAGVPVTVVPGVSSSIAAPALAGIPVTHRSLVQGFTVVSAHVPPGDPRSTLDWGGVARSRTTVVVLMGVATLGAVARTLVTEGMAPDTPAAVVADAGLPSMRTVRAPLSEIAAASEGAGIGAPAVAVVGQVAALDLLAATPGAPA